MKNSTVVITPYYEDIASPYFFEDLGENLKQNSTVIVVDDGSIKRPLDEAELSENGLKGKILRLHKNVGHQEAICIGLQYAVNNTHAEKLVIMDSDGEDRPEDIKILLDKLDDVNEDVVVAKRTSRHETFRFKTFYIIYKMLFQFFVGKKINFGNFMVLKKNAAKRLLHEDKTDLHVAASVINSKLPICFFPLARGKRYAGKSKMNMVGLVLHGLRSIMVFSEIVLVRLTLFCSFFTLAILVALALMVVLKISGLTIPGWFSTISGILILTLVQISVVTVLILLMSSKNKSRDNDFQKMIEDVVHVG